LNYIFHFREDDKYIILFSYHNCDYRNNIILLKEDSSKSNFNDIFVLLHQMKDISELFKKLINFVGDNSMQNVLLIRSRFKEAT